MAIFRESPIIGAVSGRIGGSVAVRSKAGPVLRHRPPKINQRSTLQMDARADFANTARDWRDLTAADRRSWNDFAAAHPEVNRLGVSRPLTGFQWFMRGSRALWYQTAAGLRLYLNLIPVWEWSWTTETLYLHSAWSMATTPEPSGYGNGAISPQVWTETWKIASLNAAHSVAALLDVTNLAWTSHDVTTVTLAGSTTAQAPSLANDGGTYFNARNPATGRYETYMFISTDLEISLAGNLDTTTTFN